MSLWEDQAIKIFCCAAAAVLGAVLGSFLNCAAWRTVRKESFVSGRSRCPACGHELGAFDLIPVLSWLLLRGRCRYCGGGISARYPLSELCFAIISALCVWRFGLTLLTVRNWIFLGCLFFLSLTDMEDQTIPDGSLIAAALAWAAYLPFGGGGVKGALLSLLAGITFGGALLAISLVMDRALGRESLGGGDIKLMAVSGLYLGFVGTLLALTAACVIGLAAVFAVHGARPGGKSIAFGPAIALADAAMLLFGQGLVQWYTGLLG
jgi:leader peptidase (prepilin peptidase)/N-methyltransferase